LNNISDRFGFERGFELFFKGWVIGFVKFSDLACNSDDKREGSCAPLENLGCGMDVAPQGS